MLRHVASVRINSRDEERARQGNATRSGLLNDHASDSCATAQSEGLMGPVLQDLSKLALEWEEASLSALERMRRQYVFGRLLFTHPE